MGLGEEEGNYVKFKRQFEELKLFVSVAQPVSVTVL